ncbi:MAG: hypothetical protein JW901_02185 [Dehalococcoidia bacterium]|nr:hypothetical protein [Dehalococcoidia bacterium]
MKTVLLKTLPLAVAISITASLLMGGCFAVTAPVEEIQEQASYSLTDSAQFTFGPLQITPQTVTSGQSFTVTMQINNTGTAEGTYTANLYIDGSVADSQSVTVSPDQQAEAYFQASVQTAGHHLIGIGQQTVDITAIESRIPVTVKIDNGQMDGCNPAAESVSLQAHMSVRDTGLMIKLSSPPGGFTLTGVNIAAFIKDSTIDFNLDPIIGQTMWVYGEDIAMADPVREYFTVNIYDDRRNKLYSGNYSKNLFSHIPSTVTVPVSDTYVSGDFYIEVQPRNLPRLNAVGGWDRDIWHRYVVHTWYYQLCIGYENSLDPQSWISEGGSIVPGYYPTYNWMIRAEGYQEQN